MLCTRTMSIEDTKQAEISEFEQRSERLLLTLSLEAARAELDEIVAQRRCSGLPSAPPARQVVLGE